MKAIRSSKVLHRDIQDWMLGNPYFCKLQLKWGVHGVLATAIDIIQRFDEYERTGDIDVVRPLFAAEDDIEREETQKLTACINRLYQRP